jgi:hypothetical protein
MKNIWETKLPLKIKKCMWQMFHDKLQTVEQLKEKRIGKGTLTINCVAK